MARELTGNSRTEDGDWENQSQINEQILISLAPRHSKTDITLTWKSPRFEADVYKKLTLVN